MPSRSVLRQKGSIARERSYSIVELKKVEHGLDTEILRDTENHSKESTINRLRHNGELVLHSKHILLMIVILNLLDCGLVLSELILDIHFVKEGYSETEQLSQDFIDHMQTKYPANLHGYTVDYIDNLYVELYKAECKWKNDNNKTNNTRSVRSIDPVSLNGRYLSHMVSHERQRRDITNANDTSDDAFHIDHAGHSVLEDVAHGLHKASITILGILCLENILKLVCMGLGFFHKKLEVFDAFVVVVSFVVDLVFLKGLTEYPVQDSLFILSFLLPWRVIRVVNSLIVAVLHHEHFCLKMIYREKKLIEVQLRGLKDMEKQWNFHLKKIESFCESEGIPLWKIRQHTEMGRSQSTVTSMASMALNGMINNMYLNADDKKRFNKSVEDSISQTPVKNSFVNDGFTVDEIDENPSDTTDKSNTVKL